MKKAILLFCAELMVLALVQTVSTLEIVAVICAASGSTQYITAEEFTRRANDVLGSKARMAFYGNSQPAKVNCTGRVQRINNLQF